MKLTGRSAAPLTRVRLAVVVAAAALLALPAVADAAGTVTTDGNTVTYTGSSGADNVSVQYGLFDDEVGGPSVTISTDDHITNGSPGVCVQPSYTDGNSVSCPRTASVIADLGAGDDRGRGEE